MIFHLRVSAKKETTMFGFSLQIFFCKTHKAKRICKVLNWCCKVKKKERVLSQCEHNENKKSVGERKENN